VPARRTIDRDETLTLADRVIVLGHGQVFKEVSVIEPRPRHMHADSLQELHEQLSHSIEDASRKGTGLPTG
jgi:ABC-type nitrate/sulfonate/bicarbonate transport system ATPase subunit